MNQDDITYFQAVGDLSDLQTMFLESWKKDIKNERKKAMWEKLVRIDASHKAWFSKAKMNYAAAVERDLTIGAMEKQLADYEEQISQLTDEVEKSRLEFSV